MKFQVIATRDIVANVWSQPIYALHIGQAIRSFGDECQRKEQGNVLAQHPEDFELWHIGEYDDHTGLMLPFALDSAERKQIAVGANYRT